ncbi:MAG: hypothetical protein QXQ29_05990 [Candidatus Bathyarchaeia archaeon]
MSLGRVGHIYCARVGRIGHIYILRIGVAYGCKGKVEGAIEGERGGS